MMSMKCLSDREHEHQAFLLGLLLFQKDYPAVGLLLNKQVRTAAANEQNSFMVCSL